MPKKIVQKEAPILREIAREVPIETITSPKIQKILKEMRDALASQVDGVAIAAPQIGVQLRIFIVSHKVAFLQKKSKLDGEPELGLDNDNKQSDTGDLIFINPNIKKISKQRKTVEEGCLSVRYLYGRVSRANKA